MAKLLRESCGVAVDLDTQMPIMASSQQAPPKQPSWTRQAWAFGELKGSSVRAVDGEGREADGVRCGEGDEAEMEVRGERVGDVSGLGKRAGRGPSVQGGRIAGTVPGDSLLERYF